MPSPSYASVLDYALVLPRAHWRLGDVRWQYAIYDVFHTTALSRFTHAAGMTPNTMTWTMLASLLLPGPIDGGLVVWALVAALAFVYDRLAGVVTLLYVGALWLAGQALLDAFGDAALFRTLLLTAALAFFQAVGHAPEPVPPPWSGGDTFVPVGAWLRTASVGRILGYGTMVVMGPLLEYWAAPRLLPVQVLKVLVALGHRPGLRGEAAVREVAYRADIRYAIEDRLPA